MEKEFDIWEYISPNGRFFLDKGAYLCDLITKCEERKYSEALEILKEHRDYLLLYVNNVEALIRDLESEVKKNSF